MEQSYYIAWMHLWYSFSPWCREHVVSPHGTVLRTHHQRILRHGWTHAITPLFKPHHQVAPKLEMLGMLQWGSDEGPQHFNMKAWGGLFTDTVTLLSVSLSYLYAVNQ